MAKRLPDELHDPDGEAHAEAAEAPRRDDAIEAAVRRALARVGRGDPHPDPLKPVARAAFFIWLAILAGFRGFAAAGPPALVTTLEAQGRAILRTFAGGWGAIRPALAGLAHDPHGLELYAVAGFALGAALLAVYYAVFYLAAANLLKLSRGLAKLPYNRKAMARR